MAPNIRGESFGIILAEAMAGGVPIIASNIQAFSDLLHDGEFGILFQNESPKDLAKKVVGLLADSNLKIQLGEKGRQHSATFDWSTVAKNILDVYEVALAGGGGVTLSSENRGWRRLRNE